MVIISPAVDDANPVTPANGARATPPAAANNFAPAAAWSLSDVVHGTTVADVAAGTTPWWSSQSPCYAGSSGASSSSFPPPPPPPPLQSHGHDLAGYAGSIMDTSSFPPQLPAPPPPAVYMPQPELSYFYYPQPQGFPSSCFAAPFALEPPTTTIRPQLQVPTTTQPASMPPSLLHYPQTQATTTGSASVLEDGSPALADTQLQAQEDDTGPAPRRRGRPSKRAVAMSKRVAVAVGRNRAASSPPSSSKKTSSAATGSGSATMPSAAGQVVPDQAGASSSSTGNTSGQMAALLCDDECQLQRPAFSNGAPAGVVAAEGHHHQQAAIAPAPELVATGPAPYADTSPIGVRLKPSDQELIGYLRMKYAGQQLPAVAVDIFKDFDVYQAHPMAIKGACGESQNGCWYAFSPRDRKYRNGKRPARSVFAEGGGEQVGFWKSNSKLAAVRAGGEKDGAVIGRMTSLTFHLGRQPRGTKTGWKMKEYTITENQHQPDGSAMLLNDWVVCKLSYKERRPTSTETESETDQDAMSVGQKRPRRGRKSKKEKKAIPDAAGQEEEDGPGEAAGESVQGEEDMQQMVPAAQQASDYSKQDLSVDDYLGFGYDDVEFAQQNDAANCTI